MSNYKNFLPAVLAALVLLVWSTTFIVNEWQTAIKLRLGEIVGSDYVPGLHFKVPLLNEIKLFDRRIQTLETTPERYLTVEQKAVIVDSYVKWRIANPAQYFRSTGGSASRTSRLLTERIGGSLREEFGKRTIQEVVSEDRSELMAELTKKADLQANALGVEVIDVRVKKIDLPPEVSESVYMRMRAERERVASDLRAKGKEAGERIRADADRQRTVILADAYKEAEQSRGEGDAKATEIYAAAYSADPDFYSFYRSLNAYRGAFGPGGDMMVLQPDSEFFRFFRNREGQAPASTPAAGKGPEVQAAVTKAPEVKAPDNRSPAALAPE
jgi:membrane protease subunit HflC